MKFTGDEIMMVFASPEDAAKSALKIGEIGAQYLRPLNLSVAP